MNIELTMKTKIKTATVILISSLVMSMSECKAQNDEKMNVLLIAVDDLRPALACYDDPLAISPNIDRLAKEGALFQNHYVQAPSCAPSRTSMLTGYRPDEVEVTDHKTHFRETRPEVVTLPELFKKNGYTTISLGKLFHYSKLKIYFPLDKQYI